MTHNLCLAIYDVISVYIPKKATVTRRGPALGHVSFMSDDKKDESSQSLEHLRSHLVVAMGGRAAEAIFAGEERVCTGASSDMQQVRGRQLLP